MNRGNMLQIVFLCLVEIAKQGSGRNHAAVIIGKPEGRDAFYTKMLF